MNSLIDKLERAIRELDDARKAIVSDEGVKRATKSIRKGATAVADDGASSADMGGRRNGGTDPAGDAHAPEGATGQWPRRRRAIELQCCVAAPVRRCEGDGSRRRSRFCCGPAHCHGRLRN